MSKSGLEIFAKIKNDFSETFVDYELNANSSVDFFREYVRVSSEFSALHDIKNDAIEFTKFFMKRLNLRAPKGFFEKSSENDLIEIYNSSNIQIFRTLNFFDITTYSLNELLLNDWSTLYSRPMAITEELINATNLIFSGESELISLSTPEHHLVEIQSKSKSISNVKFKNLSPIYKEGISDEVIGFIVSSEAERIYSLDDHRHQDNLSYL